MRATIKPWRIILAPSNLGLRPLRDGHEPGVWQAPGVLMEAGLRRLDNETAIELDRPSYSPASETGTRFRNGLAIRQFSLVLASAVEKVQALAQTPLVIGGDCSVLLGCLVAARQSGRCGLVHLDGHSDYVHSEDAVESRSPYSAAGMDLSLATGRGEALLTLWPGVSGPLVDDADAIQIGDREAHLDGDTLPPTIHRVDVHEALRLGPQHVVALVVDFVRRRALERVWIHLDLDVLDSAVMPAVDDPGRPGFDYAMLGSVLRGLLHDLPIIGIDVTIYDPDRDPAREHAKAIVACLMSSLVHVSEESP